MGVQVNATVDTFFENQAKFGRYWAVLILVSLTGIAWALQPVAIYYSLEPDVRVNIMNAVAADWIVRFFVPFFLWVCFWAGFSLFVKLFGGRMRPGRLFKLTGWGIAPLVLTGLVRSAGRYVAFQGQTLPFETRQGVMESEFRAYEALIGNTLGDPIIVGTTVVSCVFVLLSACIWYFGVMYSTDLERRHIVLTVAVPTALYIAYSIANSFQIIVYM